MFSDMIVGQKMSSISITVKLGLAGTLAVAIALGIGRFAYTPILPYMQSELGLSSTQLGALASWNFFGYLIGSLTPLLIPVIQIKQRRSFFIALSTSIITTGLMGVSYNLISLTIIRFIAGVSSALTLIIGTGILFKKFEVLESSRFKLSHFCGFGVGIVISAIAVPMASKFGFNWSSQWLIMALICCCLAIPVLFFMPADSSKLETVVETIISTDHSSLSFSLVAIGYGLFGIGYIIFGTFISAMSTEMSQWGLLNDYVWLTVGISATPSVFIWQKLSDVIGKDLSLSFACLLSAFGVFCAVQFATFNTLIFGCALFGCGMPGIVALALLEGKNRYSGSLTSAVAILTLSFSFGQMLGPFLAGILIDRIGNYYFAMQISVVCLFFSGVFMVNPQRLLRLLKNK